MSALCIIMGNVEQLGGEDSLTASAADPEASKSLAGSFFRSSSASLFLSRLRSVSYSLTDQGFAVGATFLANIVLARTQSVEEYGVFALCYSVFTFLSGLHSAAILEPYTVYGAGRYRGTFSEYLRLMVRSNALIGVALSACLLSFYGLCLLYAPHLASPALLGLGLSVGVLVSGIFLRRVFYLQRQAAFAAACSLVFFVTVVCGIFFALKARVLDSFSVFLILALGWIVAGAVFGRKLWFGKPRQRFLEIQPDYWGEHWKYARWLLATALVFQLTTQGYYWLLAGLLSVKDVGELKAMYNVVAPIEQVLIAFAFLALPAMASHFAARNIGAFLSVWKHLLAAAVGITAVYALGVRTFGQPILHLFYGGKFDADAPLLSILVLTPLVMGAGYSLQDALKAMERPNVVFYGYLCSGATTLSLGIVLVRHFGLQGAVYGVVLSGTVYTAALAAGFWFCLRRGSRHHREAREIGIAGGVGAENYVERRDA